MKKGLCLSGGGVKGAAHIGAIKALEEENIKFDYVSGTSSGSIIATLYAAGFSSNEMYKIFKKYCKKIKYVDITRIFKLIVGVICTGRISIDGLNSGRQIEHLINNVCKDKEIFNISDIKMPLIIPSVDMHNGEVICFTSCQNRKNFSDDTIFINDINIGKAVRASCSYPGVFSPCKFQNTKLLDGGIRQNVPWKETKLLGADKVLSVVFENDLDETCCKNLIDVSVRAFGLLGRELSNYELEGADYVLKIRSEKVGLLDMKRIDELYEIGYRQMKMEIEKIKRTLG